MSFWSARPDTVLGWALWGLAVGLVVVALVTIRRDTRGRKVTGWDGLAVAFVVVGGPGAAFVFLAVYGARRSCRPTGAASQGLTMLSGSTSTT